MTVRKRKINTMHTNDYWKFMAQLIKDKTPPDIGGYRNNPEAAASLAGECFQDGVVLIMAGEEKRGRDFLARFPLYVSFLEPQKRSPKDCIGLYMSDWMLSRIETMQHLRQAVKEMEPIYKRHIIRYRTYDIYKTAKRLALVKDDEGLKKFMTDCLDYHSDDPYAYEKMADMMLKEARIRTIMKSTEKTVSLLMAAHDFYKSATDLIGKILTGEDPEWAAFVDRNDEELRLNEPARSAAFIDRRKEIQGNIPFGKRQAEILLEISRTSMEMLSAMPEKSQHEIDVFFRDELFHPARTHSKLGLMEEMEWIFIRKLLLKDEFIDQDRLSVSEILRRCTV